jgi:N-dimethylarginine dimethylaminohydrolase
MSPCFLMTDAVHYDVHYQINPWMRPDAWQADAGGRAAAMRASRTLASALERAGARIEHIPGVAGLPDLVFPANAAIVLDGKVLLARFRHPERQGEENIFRAAFEALKARGVVEEIVDLPQGVLQEGAGDCIWDREGSSGPVMANAPRQIPPRPLKGCSAPEPSHWSLPPTVSIISTPASAH